MNEDVASSSTNISTNEKDEAVVTDSIETKREQKSTFQCSFCSLTEKYDYKGSKPPFGRDISYEEDCYIMKDPFSIPKKGEVLVIGGDCSSCNKPVCLSCSIFYTKRFCRKCATDNIINFPRQLHLKIKNFAKDPKES